MEIPVYLFTGFLEAGKTKFIQETLENPELFVRRVLKNLKKINSK